MRFFAALLFSLMSLSSLAQTPQPPALAAKAWLLLDYGANQVLTAHNAEERVEPASLTKLMTAYLTFSAFKANTLSRDQVIPVSERAWKMGGSRMFIEPRHEVTADQLVHGMIIQSGNDASVALAEAIAGSEEAFAELMNREAKRLGMTGTHFMNSTGMPDDQHYTTARDLAILAAAVVRDFPEDYRLYSEKEYTYNGIRQPNRNRLLWMDAAVERHQDRPHRSGRLLPGVLGGARSAPADLGDARLRFGRCAHPGIAQAAQLRLPVLRHRAAL
nr:D-alanyl-D-alanine carboxypeptidase family protein [Denitromonas sp.]